MWKTTTDGIQTMRTAAAGASLGGKREAALDASDGWLGAAIRVLITQTVAGVTTTRYEATHALGMTRTGEKLILPTTSWTVVTNLATVRADGPMEIRIEKEGDSAVYKRYEGSILDKDLNGVDPVTFAVEITATNIYDAESAQTPPSSVAYSIFNNVNAPRAVSAALVGMHAHRWPAITDPLPAPSYDPNHFGLVRGWADTSGHLSGPGGTYTVIKVTNRNASGSGSLRAALEASGARLVVFEVSGNIDLAQATIDIDNPYITVAGQTAPDPGITIINGTVRPRSSHFILMHLRFRPGTGAGTGKDAMETRPGAKHGVISHCSFSWGTDGTLDIGGFNLSGSDPAVWRDITSRNITIDRCIIAESLTTGAGASLVEDNANAILYYGCFFANSEHRNPLWKAGSRGAMINNLWYNGADKFTDSTLVASVWSGKTKQEVWLDALGNYARGGPDTFAPAFHEVVSNYGTRYYGSDNIVLDSDGDPLPETLCIADTEPYNTGGYIVIEAAEINGGHGVTPIAASAVPAMVEASAGAFPWARDAIDARQFTDFNNGTGGHIATQETVGGYPASQNNTRTFDSDAWALDSADVHPVDSASAEATYAYDATRVHDTEGTAWADVQVSRTGTAADFDWTRLDAVIDAHFAAGHRIIYTVHGCPQFLAKLPKHPSPYNRDGYGSAPADWADLTRFVTALCTRYRGKLHAVQWWNEPDLGWYDYATGEGGTDRWIGTVAGNSDAAKVQRRIDYAIGQKTVYQAVKSVDAAVLVYFGGFVFWADSAGVNAQVQTLAATPVPSGGVCSDYADALGFHFYGESTNVSAVLNRFRSLEATRNAINPNWRIAMDEIGSIGSVSESGHVYKIKQWLLLGAAFGCDFVGLYSHDGEGIGRPETNATISAAIDDMHDALVGQSLVIAAALDDGSVWIGLADETELQFPLTPDTPTGPYGTPSLPFAADSPWNEPIPGSASYPLDARTTQIRSTAQGVFGVNRVNWTMNVFQARSTDPLTTLRVRNLFSPSDPSLNYDVTFRWPGAAIPNGHGVSGVTDHHLVIFDEDGIHAHEMWYCYRQGSGSSAYWQSSSYCKTKITGTGWRLFTLAGRDPNEAAAGTGSPRAVNVSALGGLIRPGEVLSDGIDHALAFAVPRPWLKGATGSRVYPADTINRPDGEWINGVYTPFPGVIPYSQRFAIPPTVNLDSLGLNVYYRRFAQAMQTYGAYPVDVSGNPCFYSEWPGALADGNALMTSSAQMNTIMQQVRACDWY